MINSFLLKFESILIKYNKKSFDVLNEPLGKLELEHYFSLFKITDDDFKSLYQWKSGLDSNWENVMNPEIFDFGTILISLESMYDFIQTSVDETNSLVLLPFAFNTLDGDKLIYCNDPQSSNYRKIFLYSVPILSLDPMFIVYDDILSMIKTHIELYEKKVLIYNAEYEMLDTVDQEKLIAIYKKHNKFQNFYK